MTELLRPKVGVGILVINNDKLLMGKRKNAHGNGTWAPPGGHLEFGETPEECAQREVLEETGLLIKNIRRLTFTNDIFFEENKHYITLYYISEYSSGTPHVLEPDKCERWEWFSLSNVPAPLFLSFENFLKQHTIPSFEYHEIAQSYYQKDISLTSTL